MKKLAVIYICSGAYKVFWPEFYSSSEQYFAPNMEKTYFVFTDAKEIIEEKQPKVQTYYTKKCGWPYDALMRYSRICRIQDKLSNYDAICFCNANTQFIHRFDPDYYLNNSDFELWSTTKPGTSSTEMPLERNMKSRAGIPSGDNISHYYNSGYFYGKSDAILEMSRTLRDWTEEDLQNAVIPCCHDESMLDSYIFRHPELKISIVGENAFLPEEFTDKANPPAAIFRNKDRYGGNLGLRSEKPILGKIDVARRRIIGKIKSVTNKSR